MNYWQKIQWKQKVELRIFKNLSLTKNFDENAEETLDEFLARTSLETIMDEDKDDADGIFNDAPQC